MRIQTTIDLIDHLKTEIESRQLVRKFETLMELLDLAANSEGNDVTAEIEKNKSQLIEDLLGMELSDGSYLNTVMLNKIDEHGVTGKRGASKLTSHFEENSINPVVLLKQIKAMASELRRFGGMNTELLKDFAIKTDTIDDKSLLAVMFEGKTKVNTINDFERYARIWNKIIIDYSDVIQGSTYEPLVFFVDKELLIIDIPDGDKVLESIFFCSSRIVELYKKVLRIKHLQLEILSLSLDDEIFVSLEQELESATTNTIQNVVIDLIGMRDTGDGNEDLFLRICTSLRQIIDFLDKGGKLEGITAKPSKEQTNINKHFLMVYDLVKDIDNITMRINAVKEPIS